MFRTILPDNGYCLFFPHRKKGKQFEAGRSVRVWRWEEWKYVKLGQFDVTLPDDAPELITTIDDYECNVRADFKIVIGGPEEGREDRLRLATISVPPTRDIDKKVEFDFFQKWATNYCKTSIANIIREYKYEDLLQQEMREEAKRRIEQDAERTLASIGLILVRVNIIIEPLDPTESPGASQGVMDARFESPKSV